MAHAAARLSRVLSFEESNLPATSEPIIHAANAAAFMPPSLNAFRTKASRAAPDCAPAVWYKAMTGSTWDCSSHSYELAKKRHRRFLDGYKAAEQERERKRKRSGRYPRFDYPQIEWLACMKNEQPDAKIRASYDACRRAAGQKQRQKERSQRHVQNHDKVFVQLLQQAGVIAPQAWLEAAHFIQLVDNVQTAAKRDHQIALEPGG